MLDTVARVLVSTFTVRGDTPSANSIAKHYENCDPEQPKTREAVKATGALMMERVAKQELVEATDILTHVTQEVVERAVQRNNEKAIAGVEDYIKAMKMETEPLQEDEAMVNGDAVNGTGE